jgi:hypothetical protein
MWLPTSRTTTWLTPAARAPRTRSVRVAGSNAVVKCCTKPARLCVQGPQLEPNRVLKASLDSILRTYYGERLGTSPRTLHPPCLSVPCSSLRCSLTLLLRILPPTLLIPTERTPTAAQVIQQVYEQGYGADQVAHDHFAFRTFGVPGLGIEPLGAALEDFGYCLRDYHTFVKTNVLAAWYAPPKELYDVLPRIFVSQLQVRCNHACLMRRRCAAQLASLTGRAGQRKAVGGCCTPELFLAITAYVLTLARVRTMLWPSGPPVCVWLSARSHNPCPPGRQAVQGGPKGHPLLHRRHQLRAGQRARSRRHSRRHGQQQGRRQGWAERHGVGQSVGCLDCGCHQHPALADAHQGGLPDTAAGDRVWGLVSVLTLSQHIGAVAWFGCPENQRERATVSAQA